MQIARVLILVAISLATVGCGGGSHMGAPAPLGALFRTLDKIDLLIQGKYVPPPPLNHDDTLAGQDVNHNGVRDDLDAYIDSLPDTPEQKAAMRQLAVALTTSMTADPQNEALLDEVLRSIANATSCLHERYGPSISSAKGDEIEMFTVNTKNRRRAYSAFNAAASGHVFSGPMDSGCLN